MNIQKVVRRVVANLVANSMVCFNAFLKASVMAGVVACTMASTTVQASDLSDKLQSPEYVLLMRHTRAPGVGELLRTFERTVRVVVAAQKGARKRQALRHDGRPAS